MRVGKTDRWNSDQWNLNHQTPLTENSLTSVLQSLLGVNYNLFVIKCGVIDTVRRNVVELNVVFYKYIQRARLVKSLRMALLIATGVFKVKPPLFHVRLAQGFVIPTSVVFQLETILTQAFGKPFQLNLYNIAQIADPRYGKLNSDVRNSIEFFLRGQQNRLQRTGGDRSWPPLESRLEATWINPLAIRDSYPQYKAYSNLAYSVDVLMATLYTSIYTLSNLLADVIVRGLLRNMKQHKQFLALIETTIGHLRSFHNWPFKPLDWCIALHGKIGSGTIRSRSHYIKVGYLPLQTIVLPIDYTYRSAETKFGAIGVKIWLRCPE